MSSTVTPPAKGKETSVRVGAASDAKKIANFITLTYNDRCSADKDHKVSLRAVGAGAINQAIKAVIQANSDLVKWGVMVDIRPSFQDVAEKKIGGSSTNDVLTTVVFKLIFTAI